MPISRTDDLKSLIKSLTKAEKKNFRLYARRIQSTDDLMYLDLFDILDKSNDLTDDEIIEQMEGISKSQYSNLKRHLYSQLLTSLRLLQKSKQVNIRIREYIDFAFVLYGKGLHIQSLKLLAKARKMAGRIHNEFIQLTIIEIEKTIESRHITRSGPERPQQLVDDATMLNESISDYISLSNLRLLLHGIYIQHGHVRNAEMAVFVTNVFERHHSSINKDRLGVMHKVYLQQCYVWYYYILQDFRACGESALEWVRLFETNEELRSRDVDLYMRGYHYLLTSLYYQKSSQKFDQSQEEFENFRKSNYKKFNKVSQIISFLYAHTSRLNKYFLHGNYSKGLEVVPRTLARIRRYKDQLDAHRIMVFYYKIAWMYLGAGRPDGAVKYLSLMIQLKAKSLREDIQGYARLMLLMAHYDLENYDVMEYMIQQYERFFEHIQDRNEVYRLALQMFNQLISVPLKDRTDILLRYRELFRGLERSPFEKRTFLYLEIVPWIDSRIYNTTIEKVVTA